jgi:hypothetical protein
MDEYVSKVSNIRCLWRESLISDFIKICETECMIYGKAHLVSSVNQVSLLIGMAKNWNNLTMLVEVFHVKFEQCM